MRRHRDMWRSEGNFWDLILSLYHVGPGNRIQTLPQYSLNHLTGPVKLGSRSCSQFLSVCPVVINTCHTCGLYKSPMSHAAQVLILCLLCCSNSLSVLTQHCRLVSNPRCKNTNQMPKIHLLPTFKEGRN